MINRRLADISGPFVDPNQPFRNWSSFPFAQLDLPAPPYVDTARLAQGVRRAVAHLHELHDQGYTGIVVDNLAHLTAFDGPGEPIYAPESPARLRAQAYRMAFGELFAEAAALGMEVFITTDMQWSTPELRRAAGPLRAANPRLAELNRRAVAELFAALPAVSGLVVRVGEAGGAHNEGNAYTGHMLYTTVAALRSLIGTLLPTCEAAGRLLVLRTWSVGIGELGDLIWSPERYRAVFAGFDSPNLLASIKHGPADFFRLLPPNPTLGLPGPQQIIELQNRREYELFGLAPSGVARLHQEILARAAASPRCAGMWAWNSTGGWGGGRATLGDTGWCLWTALSSALTAALAAEPALDAPRFVYDWAGRHFASAPAFAAAVAELYLASEELIEHGWYTGPLPRGAQRLGNIYLSPLLWVWWMRPTVALPVWAYLAAAVGDVPAALTRSAVAVQRAEAYARKLAALAPGGADAGFAVTSAAYGADALAMAHATRALMLPLLAAAWSGRAPARGELRRMASATQRMIDRHRATWDGRADFPPLELDELATFVALLKRRPRALWLQARAACALVRGLRARRVGRRVRAAGAAGAAGLTMALIFNRPARLVAAGAVAGLALARPMRRRVMHAAIPWISRRLHLLPTIFFEAGPAVEEWA